MARDWTLAAMRLEGTLIPDGEQQLPPLPGNLAKERVGLPLAVSTDRHHEEAQADYNDNRKVLSPMRMHLGKIA